MCPTDLIDLKKTSSPTDEWFSVDYSAATDQLSWKYSGAIFRYITQDLDDVHRERALSVLGPHSLHYPDSTGVPVYKGEQTNGQLMGSILSFPILCLANLGVYLEVTDDHQSNWPHHQRLSSVLVNGDDMLYAAPVSLWERHIETAGKVGLD